jgi:hypothetical protein
MSTAMTNDDAPRPEKSAVRFAVVGGLAFILIAACVSAVTMLVWGM